MTEPHSESRTISITVNVTAEDHDILIGGDTPGDWDVIRRQLAEAYARDYANRPVLPPPKAGDPVMWRDDPWVVTAIFKEWAVLYRPHHGAISVESATLESGCNFTSDIIELSESIKAGLQPGPEYILKTESGREVREAYEAGLLKSIDGQ